MTTQLWTCSPVALGRLQAVLCYASKQPPSLVLLPQAALDYSALDLQPFYAGALVRFDGDFHRVADPLRCD